MNESVSRENTILTTEITGVILAGGRSTRMGGEDKGLIVLNQVPLYRYVLDRFSPQVSQVIISANRNQQYYRQSGLTVISDTLPDFPGPLAGMLAGLQAASTEWVVFAPCDVPIFPADLVTRLWQGKQRAAAAFACAGGRDHPAFSLLHRTLIPALENTLARGDRKVMLFFAQINAQRVVFPAEPPAFANLNTPQDLQQWSVNEPGAQA